MSMKSVKLLAATLMVTCGLGLGAGAGWLTTAQGQAPQAGQTNQDPQAELKRLQDQVDLLWGAAAALGDAQKKGETYTAKTTKWEYDFVVVSDLGTTKFVEFLQDRENRGWEFNGQTTLRHDGKATAVWMFRRPAQRAGANQTEKLYSAAWQRFAENVAPAKPDDATAIEAEIGRLQARLRTLSNSGKTEFSRNELPLEPNEFAELLKKMVQKRFPGRSVTIESMATGI